MLRGAFTNLDTQTLPDKRTKNITILKSYFVLFDVYFYKSREGVDPNPITETLIQPISLSGRVGKKTTLIP